MSGTRLTFTLDGRDDLSRVLGHAGDSAERLRRTMEDAADGSGQAILTLTQGADGRLRDMEGRFVSAGDAARLMALRIGDAAAPVADWSVAGQRASEVGEKLRASLISLVPAAIPAAAAIAPIAAGAGAAAVALAAFGAAVGPQIAALSEAGEAEKKHAEAVGKSGKQSQAAVDAQVEYAAAMAKLPPATRTAAASLSVLKDAYRDWSDSLSEDTMSPVVKSMAIFSAMLPRTTGLVRGTSTELDRMVTILAGGMESPGFDRTVSKFEAFATGTLREVNDSLVNLMRTGDSSGFGSGFSTFMDYARENGPMVGDTLRNLAEALTSLLVGASDVGVGMLTVVNALSGLVAAVPPEVITTLLQLAIAIKGVQLAAAGFVAARAAMAAFTVQLAATNAAASAAPGRMAALGAAFNTLSRTARLAVAGTGIGLLLIGLAELSQLGQRTPPNVDRMTTAIGDLGRSGQVTGEASRVLGKDMGELEKSLRVLARPSNSEGIQQWMTQLIGMDSTPVKESKAVIDSLDKSLANLVQSGNADLAEAALKRAAGGMKHLTEGELRSKLGDYKAALADMAFEQQLAADAMGVFGAQAQAAQSKLAAAKQSTDGLRQSINALNNAQLMARGGMRGMEAAIDAAAAAARENGRTLDINTEKGRANQEALDNVASATMRAAESARENGASWESVNGVYERGRAQLVQSAQAMGLSAGQASELASRILAIPESKSTSIQMRREDALAGLDQVIAKIKATPGKKSVTVGALTGDAMLLLTNLGFKVRRLPNGKVTVTAHTGAAVSGIGAVQAARNALSDKTITITTMYRFSGSRQPGPWADGYRFNAQGGVVDYFADGGMRRGERHVAQIAPAGAWRVWAEPETGGESYIPLAPSKRARSRQIAEETVRRLGGQGVMWADGGLTGQMMGAGADAARGLSSGLLASAGGVESSARVMAAAITAGVRAELEISSPSKKMRALMADVGAGMIIGLTGSKAKISEVAKDLVKDIWAAWKGTSSTKDSALVTMVNRDTKKLQTLATQRDALAARIAEAVKFAADTQNKARQDASLSSLGTDALTAGGGGLLGGLQKKLTDMQQFTKYVNLLKGKGLRADLLRQIVEMGPEAGLAYASTLAGASKGTIDTLNTTQVAINKESSKLGSTAMDALYDAGKNAGKGLLAGLTSQQKAIEAAMIAIAKGMQKAIKQALGIKSPSTVMAALGRHSTEGLAVGLVERMPVLDQALSAVAGRVAGARPVLGRPAVVGGVGGAGAGPVYNIQVDVQGAMDPVAVGREVQKVLVKFGRAQGGTVRLGVG
ncbi:hypothetical protein [Streptomyces sp. NPDC005953]|uniref:hypothetical protein n=1 Tax=Streptomyces sp. NPDC005953 TaxID=3156719 RepID=UPI0033C71DCF